MRRTPIADIVTERQDLSTAGLLPSHELKPNDLPKAAAALALAGVPRYAKAGWPELFWPWRRPRFRPASSRENLVRAGALILAEIERLDRQASLDVGNANANP
jgi:hypothetical protein